MDNYYIRGRVTNMSDNLAINELMRERTKFESFIWFFRYRIPYVLGYSNIRYQIRYRFFGLFQRAFRGWADHDTWGLDYHIAGILKNSLKHLAKYSHGCPHEFMEKYGDPQAFKEWDNWLLDKAEWFRWYHEHEDEEVVNWFKLTEEEKSKIIQDSNTKMKIFYDEVLPDFIKYYGNLWN